MTKQLTAEELADIEAKAVANVVAKVAAGGVPTKREQELLEANTEPAPPPERPEVEVVERPRERKPWDSRARMATIDLEPEAERLLVRVGELATLQWAMDRGTTLRDARNLVEGIRQRWAACEEEGRPMRKAELRAKLDAAWTWAANNPLLNPLTGDALVTAEGHAVVAPDGAQVPKLLKLYMDLDGLAAPSRVQHLHGHMMVPVVAMSPSDRAAEIDRLLAKHAAARAAGRAPPLPVAPGRADAEDDPPSDSAHDGVDS